MEKENRNSFKGSIGFVLAAAGSAVGLGNIWRFPYLAAKDGGGLFLLIYLILAVTFGFALLTTEIAIGRKTKQSPLTAYSKLKKGWGFLGAISSIVPFIILPYYCVIGGWVLKYFVAFLTGQGVASTEDGYFTGFITNQTSSVLYMAIFLIMVTVIVFMGVNGGIEKFSTIIMPALIIMVIGISVFSLTLSHTDEAGVTRNGLQGLKVYVIPNFSGVTLMRLFQIAVDAMGQLFYSLSIAMGIMVAYGSYVKDDDNLGKSINQIEFFDVLVAFFAGAMIIPAVFTFMGYEGMTASGPILMFISMPKVFQAMGGIGNIIGCIFFAMVLFAALTSAVSIMEAIVSGYIDGFKMSRKVAVILQFVLGFVLAVVVCLGYNKFYFEYELPNGSVAQILDIMDYISNNVLMPIVALSTCLLIGWIVKPKTVIEEVEKNGMQMGRKVLYVLMIKVIAPIFLLILLMQTFGLI